MRKVRDINLLNKNRTYEWYFLATEDNKIREKFENEFGEKMKYLAYDKKLDYNFTSKEYLCFNDIINFSLCKDKEI